jgi:hypothetical protein
MNPIVDSPNNRKPVIPLEFADINVAMLAEPCRARLVLDHSAAHTICNGEIRFQGDIDQTKLVTLTRWNE